MMNEDFTKGKWEYRDGNIYAPLESYAGKEFSDLVQIYSTYDKSPEMLIGYDRWVQFPTQDWKRTQKANGYLMAASPKMYELLKKISKLKDINPTTFDEINTVLKEANGEEHE